MRRQRIGSFFELLKRFAAAGRTVNDKPISKTYAPKVFAGEAEAKEVRLRKTVATLENERPDRNLARDQRPPRRLGIAARELKINGGVEGGGVSEDGSGRRCRRRWGGSAGRIRLARPAQPGRRNNRRAASTTF